MVACPLQVHLVIGLGLCVVLLIAMALSVQAPGFIKTDAHSIG